MKLTLDDFFTGLMAGAVSCGMHEVDDGDYLSQAARRAYLFLEDLNLFDLRFLIIHHPVYGDSTDLRDAVFAAKTRGLVTSSDGRLHITFGPEMASRHLDQPPGPRSVYVEMAREAFEIELAPIRILRAGGAG